MQARKGYGGFGFIDYLNMIVFSLFLFFIQVTKIHGQEAMVKKIDKKRDDVNSGLLSGVLNHYLNPYGINLGANWTTETTGVIRGGKKKGADYTQAVVVTLDVDWQKMVGLQGFSTHMALMNLSGRSTSNDYVGDTLIQSQETYIPHQAMIRMYYFYAEQQLLHDRLDLKLGRLSTANEFAASPFACDFISLATCGHPRNVIQHGFASWPGAAWGVRGLYHVFPRAYVQVGIYESDPWPQGGRNGWDWAAQSATGVYVPVEYGYDSVIGRHALTGYYRIGVAVDSSSFSTWMSKINASGKNGRHVQFWLILDQMIYRNDAEKDHGIYVLANFGYSSSNVTASPIKTAYNIGFLDRGFWKRRPHDQFGVMLTYYRVPDVLTRIQTMQQREGAGSFLNNAPGIQKNGMVIEGNYSFSVCNALAVTPVVQYFHHVAATKHVYGDAVLLGVKTRVVF